MTPEEIADEANDVAGRLGSAFSNIPLGMVMKRLAELIADFADGLQATRDELAAFKAKAAPKPSLSDCEERHDHDHFFSTGHQCSSPLAEMYPLLWPSLSTMKKS